MKTSLTLDAILKKDRLLLIGALIVLCGLSWYYIIYLYRQMYPMNMDAFLFAMPMSAKWTLVDFALLFLMWFVMMIAMMIPSVAPLILIFSMVNRKKKQEHNPFVSSHYLLAGYLIIWAIFSLLATVLQWLFQNLNWLNPDMVVTDKTVGGIILIVAGIFQFTPLKRQCLKHCQTPVSFIHTHWKEGRSGALKMGIKNGMYCLGCCWVLMLVLFVSGIMNLLWIVMISLFVLIEKLLPRFPWVSWLAGAALIVYGVWVMY